jgi:hypothetical protein
MEYFYDTIADKLVTANSHGQEGWVYLPRDYQYKVFEGISAVRWADKIIIAHPDLKPQMWHRGQWSEMDAVKGTLPVMTNGLLSFKTPRLSPTEQRDAFQKNYPYLVKNCRQENWFPKHDGKIKTRLGFKVVDPSEYKDLPKVIQDQLDVSPLHYRKGEIQPWDFITSQGMSFLEGNVVKYLTRYKHKNGVADLKKARTYLDKLISEVSKCGKNSEK